MPSKKIAICAVQAPFMRGGAEILVETLYKEMTIRGFNVDLINIPFKWYPPSRVVTECILWRMIDLTEVNGEKIDIVISTKFPSTVVRHTDKRIWLVHQHREVYDLFGSQSYGGFENTDECRAIRDKIVEIDNKTITEAKRIYTISQTVSNRLKQFNNIDSVPLYPPPAKKGHFNHESYGDYVLYVGRLDAKKRIFMLIDAMRCVKTGVRCIIAGKGPQKDILSKAVTDAGLDGKVRLTGYISDEEVLKLYANALAVYYAPDNEDYGFVTVEAFLSQKPVITTVGSGGVLEFVRDGENGYISNHDPVEIADKIDRLFENKKLCETMGQNGCDQVKGISWDTVIEKLIT